jgi:uncharacterized protein (DUF1810 family)
MSSSDPFDLDRFVAAQEVGGTFDAVVAELAAGAKRSHWIWFIFPQLAGLGSSRTSARFAIDSLDEAVAYLAHPILGPRLHACAALILASGDPVGVLGELDACKLCSSMTLFHRAAPDEEMFADVLRSCFAGVEDPHTLHLLGLDG